jgi:hypothetical protein
MTIENLHDHMAYTCECGSVHFNLLRSGKTECANCGKQELHWHQAGVNDDPANRPSTDVDAMVNRFLCWPLPKTFAPDCGISFKHEPDARGYAPSWPIGTNLFTADEAKAMFLHCLASDATSDADGDGQNIPHHPNEKAPRG